MIEFKKVSKRYGNVAALQDIDLVVPAGKTTVLIGPSGCGKSTMLRMVAGLIPPTSGEVLFEGKSLSVDNIIGVRRQIGYVIQDGGLFPHLTAEQNVALLARHLKKPEAYISGRIAELTDLTRFPKDGLKRYPNELSGGQKQRVALMRGLMLQPRALLLDEPLGALDPMVRHSLQTDLKEIFTKLGQTVLFVTHDMGEAAYLGDAIVLLREGKILQQGTLDDFRERPTEPFVSEFIQAQRSLVAI